MSTTPAPSILISPNAGVCFSDTLTSFLLQTLVLVHSARVIFPSDLSQAQVISISISQHKCHLLRGRPLVTSPDEGVSASYYLNHLPSPCLLPIPSWWIGLRPSSRVKSWLMPEPEPHSGKLNSFHF